LSAAYNNAIEGSNDFGKILLTKRDYSDLVKPLEHRKGWPYIPTMDQPWYGQSHEKPDNMLIRR